nr:hypothetical protein [Tanacetum cinerariifolium]
MALTFADTHNMIAYLTNRMLVKVLNRYLVFLNVSVIQYALTVNPTIYVSCIKQFWSSVSIKKTNDVVRLHALIDRRKVIITEDIVRQALRLDDAKSIDYLLTAEIFAELERMGYEKPSTKLTFYKAFFLAQWNLVRNVDSSSKFYMYPRFLQLMINAQIANLSSHTTKYTSPTLTQKVFANIRRVGGCIQIGGIIAEIDADEDVTLEEVDAEKDVEVAEKDAAVQGRQKESQSQVYHINLEHAKKVLSMQDDEVEPAKLKEVIEVVTTVKLMTEVVTAAATPITAAPSAARRRKGVVIRDPKKKATLSIIVHSEPKSKDKGKGMSYDDIRPIFAFQLYCGFPRERRRGARRKASKALKKISESFEQQAAKKQKLDEEVEKLKTHLQIILNDEDDVYTEERRYPLTRLTLDQMLNNMRLEVEEESEVSLELLKFVRRQQQEGYSLDFGVDAVEDFKEYTLRDYYCWLKTYCCWYKLKLLDNVVDIKLRLLEESTPADDKMKK